MSYQHKPKNYLCFEMVVYMSWHLNSFNRNIYDKYGNYSFVLVELFLLCDKIPGVSHCCVT